MKETTYDKLKREREELIDALKAVKQFHEALDNYQTAAYKGDALLELEGKREQWNKKLGNIAPILEDK